MASSNGSLVKGQLKQFSRKNKYPDIPPISRYPTHFPIGGILSFFTAFPNYLPYCPKLPAILPKITANNTVYYRPPHLKKYSKIPSHLKKYSKTPSHLKKYSKTPLKGGGVDLDSSSNSSIFFFWFCLMRILVLSFNMSSISDNLINPVPISHPIPDIPPISRQGGFFHFSRPFQITCHTAPNYRKQHGTLPR